MILKDNFHGRVWSQWPNEFRDRHTQAMEDSRIEFKEKIVRQKFTQFLCFNQWHALRKYCNQKGIQLFGDIPIYVNYDSADVWSNPHIFKLNEDKTPYVVAGVPPDYFSETGQLWAVVFMEQFRDEKAGALIIEENQRKINTTAMILKIMMKRRLIRKAEPELIATEFMYAIRALHYEYIIRHTYEMDTASCLKKAMEHIDFFFSRCK